MIIYQSAVSNVTTEGKEPLPLWRTDSPGQFLYTQPQKCRTLVAGGK